MERWENPKSTPNDVPQNTDETCASTARDRLGKVGLWKAVFFEESLGCQGSCNSMPCGREKKHKHRFLILRVACKTSSQALVRVNQLA